MSWKADRLPQSHLGTGTQLQNPRRRKGFLQIILSKPLSFEYLHGQIFQSPGSSPNCHDLSKMTERDLTMTPKSSTGPLGASCLVPWTHVCPVGLEALWLYLALCFTPADSAKKGNKCFFIILCNIKSGGQSCEWVWKAIKQSHEIKIHQDADSTIWYQAVLIPKIARQSDAKHRKPHNLINTSLSFSLCLVTILVGLHWRRDLTDLHTTRQSPGLKKFWFHPVNSCPVCLMFFLCNLKCKF